MSELTLTDLFCGAGGSSQGGHAVPGVSVRMAANHWRLAVESHAANFPTADHDIANISQTDPRRYPATDLLWASPECTNHSQAKGSRKADAQPDLFDDVLPDEAAERSRATMFDVLRFAEAMLLRGRPYKAIIVENVVEVEKWIFYEMWRAGLVKAGYCVHTVYLNSAHTGSTEALPAPQSRDRWYAVAHLSKIPCPDVEPHPAAWCWRCDGVVAAVQVFKRERWGRYRQQYVYKCPKCGTTVEPAILPAATAIDWSLPGERIGSRRKPLAAKTVLRIEAGLRKYARPITLEAAGHTFERRPGVRTWPVDDVLMTQHATASKGVAYDPLVVPVEGRDGVDARSAAAPMRTQTSRADSGLAIPPLLMRGYTPRNNPAQMLTPVADTAPTLTASGSPALVNPPMLVPAGGTWNDEALPVDQPARTRTTRENDALVTPFIAELRGGWSETRSVADPLATVTADGNHHGLVTGPMAFVMRNNGSKRDGGEHCTSVDDVFRTITTAGHQSLVEVDPHLLMSYYGRGSVTPVTEPVGTVTTRDRWALVDAQVAVDDCHFRMLEPHEIGAAMAFTAGYIVYGNKRERVRQYGNAVTPPAARFLISRVAAVIHGQVA